MPHVFGVNCANTTGPKVRGDPLQIDLPKGTYTPVFRSGRSEQVHSEITTADHGDPSIAVLPFSNLSPDPSDYFSDGLTEEIIHALSSVRGMRVVARTSCFALKHRNADVREVGRTLSVAFVLEGSVRKSGDALRVTVRLVSTSDGYQLWSRRYDRGIDDIFAVQDDIAREIAGMLRASTLSPSLKACAPACQLRRVHLVSSGPFHLNRQTRESFHKGDRMLRRSVASKPRLPCRFERLRGVAWFYLGLFSMDLPWRPYLRRVMRRRARLRLTNGMEKCSRSPDARKRCLNTSGLLPKSCSGRRSMPSQEASLQSPVCALCAASYGTNGRGPWDGRRGDAHRSAVSYLYPPPEQRSF